MAIALLQESYILAQQFVSYSIAFPQLQGEREQTLILCPS